jgi:hypothetical protein
MVDVVVGPVVVADTLVVAAEPKEEVPVVVDHTLTHLLH